MFLFHIDKLMDVSSASTNLCLFVLQIFQSENLLGGTRKKVGWAFAAAVVT